MEYLVSRIEDNMGLSTEWAQKIAEGVLALLGKTVPVIVQTTQEKKKSESQTAYTIVTKTTKNPTNSKPQKTQSYEQQKLVVDIVALATDCGIRQGRALMMHCVHLLIPELMWER